MNASTSKHSFLVLLLVCWHCLQLPYHLDVVSPPPRRLGVFALDKNTKTGDLVEHREVTYEVKLLHTHDGGEVVT